MLGIIKKDFLIIKANIKVFLITAFVFLVMTINDSIHLTFLLPFLCITLFISTFSYDDYNHWNAYAVALPIGRNTIVKSKYVATFLLVITVFILEAVVFSLITFMKGTFDLEEMISSSAGSLLSIVLLISIMYPLIFKYGSEKGRIVLFLAVFAVSIGIALLSSVVDLKGTLQIIETLGNWFGIILIFGSFLLFVFSYLISVNIYRKKEF